MGYPLVILRGCYCFNGNFYLTYIVKIVISHSYVSLLEGSRQE